MQHGYAAVQNTVLLPLLCYQASYPPAGSSSWRANGSILAANCDTPDPETASDLVCMRTLLLIRAGHAIGRGSVRLAGARAPLLLSIVLNLEKAPA
jgi:hypothetical protein